jgi:hypothetical protein
LTRRPLQVAVQEMTRSIAARDGSGGRIQVGKGQIGLGHYQIRTWAAWHRFLTLAMLALAFLMICAAAARRSTPTDPYHYARHEAPIALTGELPARGITASENRVARLCSQQRIWSAGAPGSARRAQRPAGPTPAS